MSVKQTIRTLAPLLILVVLFSGGWGTYKIYRQHYPRGYYFIPAGSNYDYFGHEFLEFRFGGHAWWKIIQDGRVIGRSHGDFKKQGEFIHTFYSSIQSGRWAYLFKYDPVEDSLLLKERWIYAPDNNPRHAGDIREKKNIENLNIIYYNKDKVLSKESPEKIDLTKYASTVPPKFPFGYYSLDTNNFPDILGDESLEFRHGGQAWWVFEEKNETNDIVGTDYAYGDWEKFEAPITVGGEINTDGIFHIQLKTTKEFRQKSKNINTWTYVFYFDAKNDRLKLLEKWIHPIKNFNEITDRIDIRNRNVFFLRKRNPKQTHDFSNL